MHYLFYSIVIIVAITTATGGFARTPKDSSGNERRAPLELSGVEGELEKNIRARFPAFKPKCSAKIETLSKYKKSLIGKVKKASRSMGYYHIDTDFSVQSNKNCWAVKLNVKAGEPVRVNKQDIIFSGEGKNNTIFTSLKKPYAIHDPLNHQLYKDYKSQLEKIAQENGYLTASFKEKEIFVKKKNKTAQIKLHYDTGQRYRFGKINVSQEILGDKYLQRYLILKKGELFTSRRLIEQQRLFQSSGYYAAINIKADYKEATNGQVPITISLTSKKRNHYRGKIGYGTNTGIRARVGMNRRWTSSSGKKLDISLGLSQYINDISVQWTIPKNNPLKNNTVTFLSYKNENINDIHSRSFKLGVIGTTLQEADWTRSLSLTHLSDRTKAKGQSEVTSELTLLGIEYATVRAKDRLFPKDGWRTKISAEGALDKLLSDASVLQLKVHAKNINTFNKARFITRFDFGTTLGESLDDLPKDLRFFSGGLNHVRGYNFESLGEVNSSGSIVGGNKLAELSFEVDYPIFKQWSIAGFVDAGNAFDDFEIDDIKVGVGAGLRWHSPLGPVRIDLASPMDDPSDVHIHLSIGTDL
ncbi:MAG: outer membrane protein assembly factor [Thiotrichaceae bacterium]|nr:outer membrane protein assembly factor [Thiotrichaceae bacterium]